MRQAIQDYVERKKNAFARCASCLGRINDISLTAAEADEWLAKLESGDNAELPTCHK